MSGINENRGKKVVLGMSGGVDSSVAAVLLLEAGYEVIGITMDIGITQKAVEDAREVAHTLGIEHHTLDLSKLFQEKVINYFIQEYMLGRTPNPCIVCNKNIKFGRIMEEGLKLGAEYVATGHYARTAFASETGRYLLLRAKDLRKDQSYVLYTLKQQQLRRVIFPLGNYTKAEIREKASYLGLSVAQKAESQEICFIPDNDYKAYLRDKLGSDKIKPGLLMDTNQKIIGSHQGLADYTIGQRKGLGLALGYPAYVVAIEADKNIVIIGKEEDLYQHRLLSIENNFISIEELGEPMEVEAKVRYSSVPAKAVITPAAGNRVEVYFPEPQRAITPGQAIVYYQGDTVLGGGIIDHIVRD